MRSKEQWLAASQKVLPGGVNSPVRAFQSVAAEPVIATTAKGAKITDADGTSYIDYVCSYGPLIFGHAPDFIVETLCEAVARGTTYGFTTPLEVELAEMVVDAYPGLEMVRLVNSGTEATMSALRLARAYTGRHKILKFEGHYHGHHDSLLVKSGSGALSHGVPTSLGLDPAVTANTIVCRYNDEDALARAFAEHKGEIACLIMEPVAGNMGMVPPAVGFLAAVRNLCSEHGTLLLFDEVITGFRLGYHSAAGYFGVEPDLVCFGKIIGGGLPVGAYGGKAELMTMISPAGPVYQGGTLSGNPLAMTAGLATLRALREQPQVYDQLAAKASYLQLQFDELIASYGIPATTSRLAGLFCLFFTAERVHTYEDVMAADLKKYQTFFEGMRREGVLLAPSQFESWFLSTAHDDEVLAATVAAAERVFSQMRKV